MAKKLVICTCGKSFKDSDAMSRHKGDSPRHPPPPKNTSTQVEKPVQTLTVQDQVPDALVSLLQEYRVSTNGEAVDSAHGKSATPYFVSSLKPIAIPGTNYDCQR